MYFGNFPFHRCQQVCVFLLKECLKNNTSQKIQHNFGIKQGILFKHNLYRCIIILNNFKYLTIIKACTCIYSVTQKY